MKLKLRTFCAVLGLGIMAGLCSVPNVRASEPLAITPQAAKSSEKKGGCDFLSQLSAIHIPQSDVTHRPAADVSADLNAAAFALPHSIQIPIAIDTLERLGVENPVGLEGNANIANAEVYMDGRIVYNGQDLTQNLQGLCPVENGAESKDTSKKKKSR